MAKKKEKKIRELKVKVPVYATQIVEGNFTYDIVIKRLKEQLDYYNEYGSENGLVAFSKSNKTQRKIIQSVNYFDYIIGEESHTVPALLLKTTTYITNIHDAFTEEPDGTIRFLSSGTKHGNEHNYMLFYPNFSGFAPNQKVNWLIFVCGNSNKYDTEIIETAKLVIGGVLKLGFIHIKPNDILEKLKTSVPIFKIRYIGIEQDFSDNEKFPSLLVEAKLKREKTKTYKDISFDKISELLKEDVNPNEYQTREISFEQGKQDYKIIRKFLGFKDALSEYDEFDNIIEEAQQIFQETAEQTFTDNFIILETEDKSECLHNLDFIIEKIAPIISNYIVSYNV